MPAWRAALKLSRGEFGAIFQDRPHRMTPWGVQYWLSPSWIPPTMYAISGPRVCGKWIRDVAFQGRSEAWYFGDVQRSNALRASSHDEVTDPTLDAAGSTRTEAAIPRTTTCKIAELPSEILQQILSHLIPSGCAFQFFLASEVESTVKIPCVQKFVPHPHLDGERGDSRPRRDDRGEAATVDPCTGPAYFAIAATCRRLQDEVYSLVYAQNTFIFHLTECAINHKTRLTGTTYSMVRPRIRAWTRTIPQYEGMKEGDSGLGPLSTLAAAYLRKVILLPSLPPAPIPTEMTSLTTRMSLVSAALAHASLHTLTIDFQPRRRSMYSDRRYTKMAILQVDALFAERSEDGTLSIVLDSPQVTPVRHNRAQRVLEPLLGMRGGSPMVKDLVVSGRICESLRARLEATFRGGAVARSSQDVNDIETRPAKKRRL